MPSLVVNERLWRRVNDHFRHSGQLYVDAPRPRRYARKARLMFRRFPRDHDVLAQAAYLVKNLVNLQRYPDANKRTASVLLEVFLETNGHELRCDDDAYAAFLLEVQRRVPTARWDGRSFSLRPDYIEWHSDEYHGFLVEWLAAHTKKKG